MGVSQSKLSDYATYGLDLVVAVTQASVNATLLQLMAGLTTPEVTACFVYDNDNNLVPIDYEKLVESAKGSDPFAVPGGANPATDPHLVNLADANFAGAVRAKLGLPNLPLSELPPIATLGAGSSAPVLFNLMCAEFQIVGFEYGPRGKATWINQSQPSGTGKPWYFSANVYLNMGGVPHSDGTDPDSGLPQAVRDRIAELQSGPKNAFTIQKLFLDLDQAILASVPSIEGIPPGWAVWELITSIFLGAYFDELRKKGNPVLAYSFTVADPRPTTMELGSVTRECSPLLGADGKPIVKPTPAELNATALVYIGSSSVKPPVPVPFPWNWVDLADVTKYSGVQAVRRDVFFGYFAGLINPETPQLCIDTKVSMSHDGETFSIRYGAESSSKPAYFRPVASVGPPDSDGFTDVLALKFDHTSHDDSETASEAVEIWGDFNYSLDGGVAVKGNQIRVRVHAKAYMKFRHREVVVKYTDLDGKNYYDKTLTVLYTMGAAQDGSLQVTETRSTHDKSSPFHFDPQGLVGLLNCEDEIARGLKQLESRLHQQIDSAFALYADELTKTINGYHAWVFPGNDAFVFKNPSFSQAQDLTTELTYVNPAMNAIRVPGQEAS